MQMLGQNDDRIDGERVALRDRTKSGSEQRKLIGQQTGSPVGEIDREEETSARNDVAAVICHRGKIR